MFIDIYYWCMIVQNKTKGNFVPLIINQYNTKKQFSLFIVQAPYVYLYKPIMCILIEETNILRTICTIYQCYVQHILPPFTPLSQQRVLTLAIGLKDIHRVTILSVIRYSHSNNIYLLYSLHYIQSLHSQLYAFYLHNRLGRTKKKFIPHKIFNNTKFLSVFSLCFIHWLLLYT